MSNSVPTPLVIVSTALDGVTVEHSRFRGDPDTFYMRLHSELAAIVAAENPDEVIIRVLRPVQE